MSVGKYGYQPIKLVMMNQGVTAKRLAEDLNLSYPRVNNILSGYTLPTEEEMYWFSYMFQHYIGELFFSTVVKRAKKKYPFMKGASDRDKISAACHSTDSTLFAQIGSYMLPYEDTLASAAAFMRNIDEKMGTDE